MAKLYWRVKRDGKWTWTPADVYVEIAMNGKRRLYVEAAPSSPTRVYITQVLGEEE